MFGAISQIRRRRRVGFRSLTEGMDTTTAQGKLLFSVFGALAELERSLIRERVKAGLAAAAKRGRRSGCPTALLGEKIEAILKALDQGASQASACWSSGVPWSTLIDILKRAKWTRNRDSSGPTDTLQPKRTGVARKGRLRKAQVDSRGRHSNYLISYQR